MWGLATEQPPPRISPVSMAAAFESRFTAAADADAAECDGIESSDGDDSYVGREAGAPDEALVRPDAALGARVALTRRSCRAHFASALPHP